MVVSMLSRGSSALAALALMSAVSGCGALGSDAEAGDLAAVEPGKASTSPSTTPTTASPKPTKSPSPSPSTSLLGMRDVSISIININDGTMPGEPGYTQVRMFDDGCDFTPGPWKNLPPQTRVSTGGTDSEACFEIRLYSPDKGGQMMWYSVLNRMAAKPSIDMAVANLAPGHPNDGTNGPAYSFTISEGECKRLGGDTPGWWFKRTGDNSKFENYYVLINGVGADQDTCPT